MFLCTCYHFLRRLCILLFWQPGFDLVSGSTSFWSFFLLFLCSVCKPPDHWCFVPFFFYYSVCLTIWICLSFWIMICLPALLLFSDAWHQHALYMYNSIIACDRLVTVELFKTLWIDTENSTVHKKNCISVSTCNMQGGLNIKYFSVFKRSLIC